MSTINKSISTLKRLFDCQLRKQQKQLTVTAKEIFETQFLSADSKIF